MYNNNDKFGAEFNQDPHTYMDNKYLPKKKMAEKTKMIMQHIYTNELRHFANKLQHARTRVTAYTFNISTRVL